MHDNENSPGSLPLVRSRVQLPAERGDALSRFLAQVRATPFLTAEEELDYARRWYDEDDAEAGHALIAAHLRLVVKIAFQYHRQWASVLDLIQEGNLGLLEALHRFDPYRHNRFSTYARYWIRAMILRFLLDNYRLVKFSSTRAGRKVFFQLQKERERLIRLGIDPTTPRLAKALNVHEDDIRQVAMHMDRPALDLDAPASDHARPLHETIAQNSIASPEDQVANGQLSGRVQLIMDSFGRELDGRELEIWQRKMVAEEPASFSELGELFGVSKQRVAQVERRIKARLRKRLEAAFGGALSIEML